MASKVAAPRVDSRRPLQHIDVRTTPAPLLLPATIGSGTRHRPTSEMVVASALDYCHKLDRELRQLGLRKEERRMFVRALVVNPHDPHAASLDKQLDRAAEDTCTAPRGPDEEAAQEAVAKVKREGEEVADILRAALSSETNRLHEVEGQLAQTMQQLEKANMSLQMEAERAEAAEAVQRQLQDKLRRHRLAWDGRAKHAADTVSTMKRMAEMEEQTKGQQRDQLLAELDMAQQHVQRAEHAIAQCEQSKARMAESFAAMERELKDVRRQALAEQMQHEDLAKFLKAAKDRAEAEAQSCREQAQKNRDELESVRQKWKQERGMKNLSHKSGLRMRDDVQTNQLKCLDMEGKIARHAQQRQELEDQLADTKRNLATESKARHALQRQIQGLTRDLARQQAKEKVLDDELSSFAAQTEDQELRLVAETRGRKFFQKLLKECEMKLAAVLAGRAGGTGRWDAAGSLISNLLETSTIEDEDLSMEMSLLRMSEFIQMEASSSSIGKETDAADSGAEVEAATQSQTFLRPSKPEIMGAQSASPVSARAEDPDLIVAMVVRNMVAAVEASQ